MTILLLAWAMLTLSLLNTILLLWLGAMVLFNAQRRTGMVWIISGAMLGGGLLFAGHASIVGNSITMQHLVVSHWWLTGWGSGIVLPFAWYIAILWHAGYWENRQSLLYRRHRPWLMLTVALALAMASVLVSSSPLPTSLPTLLAPLRAPAILGVPLIAVAYPVFIVLCISLSLTVLRHPAPPTRVMGDLARRRARPWLMATSLALLAVSLLVGGVIFWLAVQANRRPLLVVPYDVAYVVGATDLAVVWLIAISILFLGQAIVSYEIFTGQALPRRGLARRWHGVILLALAYSLVVGACLMVEVPPLYLALLIGGLLPLGYALQSWRSYRARERSMNQLRPFVFGPRLYDSLLRQEPAGAPDAGMAGPFRALCAEVLGVRVATLSAAGPLASLVGPPLVSPEGAAAPAGLAEIAAACAATDKPCLPVDPERFGGAVWAVPLWGARGLAGVLLLGEKRGGGLFTEEEIDLARAAGERLIDTQATASMAQRLMALQRQRMAEGQVLDRRTRRVLHDDVLPQVHAALLALSGHASAAAEPFHDALSQLADAHHRISNLLREMPASAAPDLARLGLPGALRRLVEDEMAGDFDAVDWEIDEDAGRRAEALPALAAEVTYYAAREAVRNAARYARGPDPDRPLRLRVSAHWHSGLLLVLEDDGVGASGDKGPLGPLSPDHKGGSGQGLALHGTLMAVIGGSLTVESGKAGGTRVVL